MTRRSITIVGASLAGLRAAEALRRADFDGAVELIGDETHLPYDRPPLSKQVLSGAWEPERPQLIDHPSLGDLGIETSLGVRATSFDLESRRLGLDDGLTRTVDGLLIATGARVRTIPDLDGWEGVHTLRSLDDCIALRAAFDAGPKRVVVIGAGFIGAEVAATARERGIAVTLCEALPYPMARVLGEDIGKLCGEIHTDHGVDLRCGVVVETVSGDACVERVHLSDGSTVEADVVVVGIGVQPNTEWLEGSGLTLDNGVVCDATCLAAPGVTAAGDVARWPNARFGELMRVEHWDNAVEQGGFAARRLLLADADPDAPPYQPVPWFWSDQYDRKIQMAGRPQPGDDTHLVTGSLEERRFAVIYGRAGRLTGVFGMNRPRHVMQYRVRIQDDVSWEDAIAAAAA